MNNYVTTICKIGHGTDCCRYLVLGGNGFECMKKTPMKNILDTKVENGKMLRLSDNCDGLFVADSIIKLNSEDNEKLSGIDN